MRSIALLGLATIAMGSPAEAEESKPLALHQQTKSGVTVRIEKVAIERVLNEPGWIARQFRPLGQEGQAQKDPSNFPARFVRLYISVTGGRGNAKVDLALPKIQKINGQRLHAAFDWYTKSDTLTKLDEETTGIEVWRHIPRDTPWEEVFPNTVQVNVISNSGEEIAFTFEGIEL